MIGAIIFLFSITINSRKIAFFTGSAAFILALLFLNFAYQQYRLDTDKDYAIVFEQSTYIKSAPDESSVDIFVLHEGVKLEVIDKLGEWQKIRLADGKTGWVPQEHIILI